MKWNDMIIYNLVIVVGAVKMWNSLLIRILTEKYWNSS